MGLEGSARSTNLVGRDEAWETALPRISSAVFRAPARGDLANQQADTALRYAVGDSHRPQ
jgi:hypothetical protein